MTTRIDTERFGPWALITGASSGIGKEFARQLASSGINLVLVARRYAILEEVGQSLTREFGIEYRAVMADLSEDVFLHTVVQATHDLDLGLIVSNAGAARPGSFLEIDRAELINILRLNSLAHLQIAHHFGSRLAKRGRGGIVFVGAMGAAMGIPFLANDSATKAYVQVLGETLHFELEPVGVNVTVLLPGGVDTPIIEKFGLDPTSMPMKLISVEQCVREGLQALQKNRATHLPGRMNRIMQAAIPASMSRGMMGRMMAKGLVARARSATT
jgi:uncharacterized protein